jgi:hypothetical protein
MMPFEECPICGGELVEQEVGKLLKDGVRIFFVILAETHRRL